MKEAAAWLLERLGSERIGASGSALLRSRLRVERRLASQDPEALGEGAPGARRASTHRLALAHGAALSARLPVPRALPRAPLPPPPSSTSTPRWRGSRGSSRRWRCSRSSSCASPGRSAQPGSAVHAHKGSRDRQRKDSAMDSTLRLIAANPVDRLARTVEALLVVASAPLSVEELREATQDDPERIETALGLLRRALSAKVAAGSCSRHVAGGLRVPGEPRRRRGMRAALRAPGRARPLAGGARDARDRGLPRALLAARVARIRGVAADSAVASLVERGLIAEAGARADPAARSATGRRRSSSASSDSRASPRSRVSTTSARTRQGSASGCSRSRKLERPRSEPGSSADATGREAAGVAELRSARRRRAAPARARRLRDPVDVELGAADHEVDVDLARVDAGLVSPGPRPGARSRRRARCGSRRSRRSACRRRRVPSGPMRPSPSTSAISPSREAPSSRVATRAEASRRPAPRRSSPRGRPRTRRGSRG